MTRRPPADVDEDTLIMRRPRFERAAAKPRVAERSTATWLGLAMLAILLAGAAGWVIHVLDVPAPGLLVDTAPQQATAAQPAPAPQRAALPQPAATSQQPASAPQQTALPQPALAPQQVALPQPAAVQQQALLPKPAPTPPVTDARLAEINGLRHSGT